MIDARELRIGNWVQIISIEQNVQLTSIDKIGLVEWEENGESYEDSLTGFEPIPLTSEILIACGFEKTIYDDRWQWLSTEFERVQPHTKFRLGIMDDEGIGYSYEDGVANVLLTNLHQLQNLYYCLTGTELNYKNIKP